MTALVEENTNTPTLRIEVLGEAPVYSLNMQRVSKKKVITRNSVPSFFRRGSVGQSTFWQTKLV
jgi:hypothetical protein